MKEKPIRVLQVMSNMNRGGAETMIMNVYRKIDRNEVQFDFVVHSNKKSAYEDEIKELGGKIFSFPNYKGSNHFEYKKAWNDFFKENIDYKIIHAHKRSTASIYLKIAKKYQIKTIIHSHSASSKGGFASLVKKIFQLPLRYRADYLFACSKNAGKWLFGKKAVDKGNFYVIKNAIDLNKFDYNKKIRENKRKEMGLDNQFVIGHIGTFNEVKNQTFIIDIFNQIIKRCDDARLMLVGGGAMQNIIEKKITETKLQDKVILTGIRDDVAELLQAMDIFVFPSLYEGLPLTLIEAQAAGLNCIISDSITDEVKITSLIESLPLNEGVRKWTDKVLSFKDNNKRGSVLAEMKKSGYNIDLTTEWLQEFYLNEQEYNHKER